MAHPVTKVIKAINKNPIAFMRRFFPGAEPWQEKVIELLWNNSRVAVVSCNGAGKTWMVGRAVVTWLIGNPGSVVVTTAGTWAQVRNQVWKEINSAHARLPEWLHMGKPCKVTSWHLTAGWYAVGLSTNDVYHFEGFHSPRTLVVVDECKSATDSLFDAIARIFAGKGNPALLAVSSTGMAAGPHYNAFNDPKIRSKYARLKVNPFEAYYILPGDDKKHALEPTKALSKQFIQDMKEMYGEDSPMYKSIVMAEWTEDVSAWCLFPPSVLRDCADESDCGPGRHFQIWIGGDVAHSLGGDESVLYATKAWVDRDKMEHYRPMEILPFRTDDAEVYADNVMALAGKHGVPSNQVNIEADGIGGPTCDILDRRGFRVNRIVVGSSATEESPRLANMRAQLWWNGHTIARTGRLHSLTDEMTRAQLAEVHYGHNAKGEIIAEAKESVRARISRERPRCPWRSSDRADALLLSLLRARSYDSSIWDIGNLYG